MAYDAILMQQGSGVACGTYYTTPYDTTSFPECGYPAHGSYVTICELPKVNCYLSYTGININNWAYWCLSYYNASTQTITTVACAFGSGTDPTLFAVSGNTLRAQGWVNGDSYGCAFTVLVTPVQN